MSIKPILILGMLVSALGAGCAQTSSVSVSSTSTAPASTLPATDTSSTQLAVVAQNPIPSTSTTTGDELPPANKRWEVNVPNPNFPFNGTLEHPINIQSIVRNGENCVYLNSPGIATNLIDIVTSSSTNISQFIKDLDTGTYSQQEMIRVNQTAQAYSRQTNGGPLSIHITCKIHSNTQGDVYLVMGTHEVSNALQQKVHALKGANLTYMANYATYADTNFLVITPKENSLTVRRDLAGVTQTLNSVEGTPCEGALIQEYQLSWQCFLGYVKKSDDTYEKRTRNWNIHLAPDDRRRDTSFVVNENVGTEAEYIAKHGDTIRFMRPRDFENDTARLEWDGNSWNIVANPKP